MAIPKHTEQTKAVPISMEILEKYIMPVIKHKGIRLGNIDTSPILKLLNR